MSIANREERALAAIREHVRKTGIGSSLRNKDPHGEAEGVVHRPDHLDVSASTEILLKDCADLLFRTFPGFMWAVQPSEIGKVFNVFCLNFSSRWGYVVKYTDVMYDPRRREALKAARTILKRFGYHGSRYDPEQMNAIPRDVKGEAIPITDGMKADRNTTRAKIERALKTGAAHVVGTKDQGVIVEMNK